MQTTLIRIEERSGRGASFGLLQKIVAIQRRCNCRWVLLAVFVLENVVIVLLVLGEVDDGDKFGWEEAVVGCGEVDDGEEQEESWPREV